MNQKLYHLTGPDGQEYETTERGTVYDYKSTKIYGCRDCKVPIPYLERGTYKTVFFKDEETAVKAGFRPCAKCLPKKYDKWKNGEDFLSLPFPVHELDK